MTSQATPWLMRGSDVDCAMATRPTTQEILTREAEEASIAGQTDAALRAVAAARSAGQASPDILGRLASICANCGDFANAAELYRQGVNLYPRDAQLLAGLGEVLRILGSLEQAETAFDRALALAPHDYESQFLRSSLRRQTLSRNHIDELAGLFKQGVKDWRGATKIAFSLAKELGDIGQHAQAAYHLNAGSRIKRQHISYDVEDDVRMMRAIAVAFTQEACRPAHGNVEAAPCPIFIVGLPRTGSTLVERILSSHNAVCSAGELDAFTVTILAELARMGTATSFDRLSLPQRTLDIAPEKLAIEYMSRVAPFASEKPYLIDKMPLNFLNIGLINRAFPLCKIVHLVRNPLDTCFAIHKHLFKDAYPYSYQLTELGQYYAAYRKLMAHWHAVMPGRIIDIQYEAIVADQESTTRRLLQEIGLDWDPCCLRPQANSNPSTTASASQVRQAVYASSVDAWKPYARYLDPLIRILIRERIDLQQS